MLAAGTSGCLMSFGPGDVPAFVLGPKEVGRLREDAGVIDLPAAAHGALERGRSRVGHDQAVLTLDRHARGRVVVQRPHLDGPRVVRRHALRIGTVHRRVRHYIPHIVSGQGGWCRL